MFCSHGSTNITSGTLDSQTAFYLHRHILHCQNLHALKDLSVLGLQVLVSSLQVIKTFCCHICYFSALNNKFPLISVNDIWSLNSWNLKFCFNISQWKPSLHSFVILTVHGNAIFKHWLIWKVCTTSQNQWCEQVFRGLFLQICNIHAVTCNMKRSLPLTLFNTFWKCHTFNTCTRIRE